MKALWQPADADVSASHLLAFQRFVEQRHNTRFGSYHDLHRWSIEQIPEFWSALWSFCDIRSSTPLPSPEDAVDALNLFPGTRWFRHSRLNFAENLLRYDDNQVALVGLLENGQRRSYTYAELHTEVAVWASAFTRLGVSKGDRVAALLPNTPDAVIAMLATASIGALWSSCSPDFGVSGACDRFQQIEPKLLLAADGYLYSGKYIDCGDKVKTISNRLDTLDATVIVPTLHNSSAVAEATQHAPCSPSATNDTKPLIVSLDAFLDRLNTPAAPLSFTQLPFDHPLYILYSSGTTGIPKCIVHSAGGTLLQHRKEHHLHTDLRRDDVLFYFTTCGWMMWNWLVSGLASGCTLVLFDGAPVANEGRVLLDAIDDEAISVFGTSAKYLSAIEKQGLVPKQTHSLQSLRTVLSTGSVLSETGFDYVYNAIKADVCLSSISGGTDIVSCFMLGNPLLPVYRGEIQCKGLGMAVEFWSENGPVADGSTGELVCTRPFPSTPLGFWNDPNNSRFIDAYFASHPGVWTHGDYGACTPNKGIILQGRSDAVLNPGGVRIGTAELYRQIDPFDEIVDAVAVGQHWDNDERVVLFVVLRPGHQLTDTLRDAIKRAIRVNTTPRHVPAKILQVTDIPRTLSGKNVELAVREVIHGRPVKNTEALANPEALAYFMNRPELTS